MAFGLELPNAMCVAQAVAADLESRGIDPLMALPYNHNKPAESNWWVQPSKKNPAFMYGKFAFEPQPEREGRLFCGLHIEKGFGPPVALLMRTAKQRRLLMHDDWMWHKFISDLRASALDAPVRAVVDRIHDALRVVVRATYWKEFELDFETDTGVKRRAEGVEFRANVGSIEWEHCASRSPSKLLKAATRATTLAALGEALVTVPDHDWVWIDFLVGYDFTMNAEPREPLTWTATNLYDGVLRPFLTWFE
jgi:hypothetical protein